jgi:hypothetical protein
MRMSHLLLVVVMYLCTFATARAQQTVWFGAVRDLESGQGLAGASVRVEGANRGTYTRTGGIFRLPLASAEHTLIVRSIGYRERRINISPETVELDITLTPAPIQGRAVTVTGEIETDEIIRRAIAKKEQNAKRITTLVSTIYTKTRTATLMNAMTEKVDDGSIAETYATVYDQRQPERRKHTVLQNRRQTKNVNASANSEVFDEFYDFMEDEIVLLNTRLITPLGAKALKEYRYTLNERRMLGDMIVYDISFEPRSRLFPGFEGRLLIAEHTYQVVEAEFAPTEQTSIPFIRNFRIAQKLERVEDSLWVPMYQHVSGRAGVAIIKGLAEFDLSIQSESFVTNAVVNQPIADSLLRPAVVMPKDSMAAMTKRGDTTPVAFQVSKTETIAFAPDVDSAQAAFWSDSSLAVLTDDERAVYAKADTAKPRRQSSGDEGSGSSGIGLFNLTIGPLGVSFIPEFNRTAITGWMYGGEVDLNYSSLTLSTSAVFGERDTKGGAVSLRWRPQPYGNLTLSALASVHSRFATVQAPRSVLARFDNLNINNILYAGQFDFFRRDGFEIGANAKMGKFSLAILGAESRHIIMPVIDAPSRPVLVPQAGAYRTLTASLGIGESSIFDMFMGTSWPVRGTISYEHGWRLDQPETFASVSLTVESSIPTFSTGYVPMTLDVKGAVGVASATTPVQFQFNAMRRFPFMGSTIDMFTVPVNAFGGTRFAQVHFEHNFSDLWWRVLGLPTFNNRGPDLIGAYSVARYEQRGALPFGPGDGYGSTTKWYSEAGFGVGRIPTFFSEIFFLRVDVRWPVGPFAVPIGTFGWSIGFTSPLL